jgi:hypothetical protein
VESPGHAAWTVSASGVGPVTTGMTLADAEARLGADLGDAIATGCEYRRVPGHDDLLLMFMDGSFARADVRGPRIQTDAGIRVGDPEARVRERYGTAVTTTPHKYEPSGRYLTVDAGENRRIVFETDGTAITLIRAGRLPEVEWVEGCG